MYSSVCVFKCVGVYCTLCIVHYNYTFNEGSANVEECTGSIKQCIRGMYYWGLLSILETAAVYETHTSWTLANITQLQLTSPYTLAIKC